MLYLYSLTLHISTCIFTCYVFVIEILKEYNIEVYSSVVVKLATLSLRAKKLKLKLKII